MVDQALLDEIDELLGTVDRMKEAGFEGSNVQNYENLGISYNQIGDYEKSREYFLKALECMKLEAAEKRHDPIWFSRFFNLLGTMIDYAENDEQLKALAIGIAKDSLEEFGYNPGSVSTWVNKGLYSEFMDTSEAVELVEKMFDVLDPAGFESQYDLYTSLRELAGRLRDDPNVGSRIIESLRECASKDADVAEDFKDLVERWG